MTEAERLLQSWREEGWDGAEPGEPTGAQHCC